jgi:hypothetical protein
LQIVLNSKTDHPLFLAYLYVEADKVAREAC